MEKKRHENHSSLGLMTRRMAWRVSLADHLRSWNGVVQTQLGSPIPLTKMESWSGTLHSPHLPHFLPSYFRELVDSDSISSFLPFSSKRVLSFRRFVFFSTISTDYGIDEKGKK